MKRFLILLFGTVCGFVIGFISYGKALIAINNLYTYAQEKYAEFTKSNNSADENEVEETLVSDTDSTVVEEVEFVEEEINDPENASITLPENVVENAVPVDEQPKEKAKTSAENIVMIDTIHGKNGVAATINGKPISVDEIRLTYDANPHIKEKISFDKFYDKAIRVYVEGKILYDAAVANNILETEDYKKQVSLLQQDIARKVFLEKTLEKSINEKSLRQLYADYLKTFKSQKEIRAKHILVENEKLAKDVISKLEEGQKFDTLAEQYSKEPAELGYFTKDMMVDEFGEAAFALKSGEYTKNPVATEFGYHVILVEDIRDSKPATYEEAAPQLKQMMTSKVMDKLYEEVKKGVDVMVYDYKGKQIPLEEPSE